MPESAQEHTTHTKKSAQSSKLKHSIAGMLLGLVVFVSAASFMLYPKPAHAFLGVGDVTAVIADIPAQIFNALKKAADFAYKRGKDFWLVAYYNAARYFAQRVAYDAAVYLASGSKGQKPLYYDQPWYSYLKNIGDEAAGQFLDEMSKNVIGKGLCEPLSPFAKLQLTLSVKSAVQPRRPQCTVNKILANLGATGDISLRDLELKDIVAFRTYFREEENDVGRFLQARAQLEATQRERTALAKLERQTNKGLKDLTNVVNDAIKTPAVLLEQGLFQLMTGAQDYDRAATEALATKSFSYANLNIALGALRTFTNTFVAKRLKRLFEKGYGSGSNLGLRGPQEVVGVTGIAEAKKRFREIIKPVYATGSDLNYVTDLSLCPPKKADRRWNNCRIDEKFQQAITAELTVQEAVDQGLLRAQKAIFGYDKINRQEPRYNEGYPYSSLAILRTYRIVPVGWELAALYIRDIDPTNNTYTLQDMLDCFEDKDEPDNPSLPVSCQNENGINPFYHLVDPNWVLKAPAAQCQRKGPGPEVAFEQSVQVPFTDAKGGIQSETKRVISRADWCADARTCIQENDQGGCDFYGYCVEERPSWRLNGETCPDYFNTCQTFTDAEGSTDSYLANTLKTCDAAQVGCSWYATYFNPDPVVNEWEGNTDLNGNGVADRVYLNGRVRPCDSGNEGCSLFFELQNIGNTSVADIVGTVTAGGAEYADVATVVPLYLKKAPDYLNCPYDINDPSRDAACDNFAQVCVEDDVGCAFYTPLNGDPRISAAIDLAGDACSGECVGFSEYTEVPSYFEDVADGIEDELINATAVTKSFVPQTGQACTEAGCEQFTNLDEVARGGEGIVYYTWIRQCVSPGAPGSKVYFTWEGSDTTGYQLKRWSMLEGAGGAPCTTVQPGSSGVCLETVSCTVGPDSPTCLTFFDTGGNSFNADLQKVVYSSDDCHPLRRTEGGEIYYGIPSLSTSCSAVNVDCREYRGAGSYNMNILFVDDFEDGTSQGWSGETAEVAREALTISGYSLKYRNIEKKVSTIVERGKFYTISFLAKGSDLGSLALFDFENKEGDSDSFSALNLTSEWNYYQLGPVEIKHDISDQEVLRVVGAGFFDFVTLRESSDNSLLIKDSWDQDLADQCAAEDAYNCQLYVSGSGEELALKSFSRLCQEEYVGCKALVDTKNTLSPQGISYNTDNDGLGPVATLDNVSVPSDEAAYLVDKPDARCQAAVQGCQLVGVPLLDRQQDEELNFSSCSGADCTVNPVLAFNETYLINNPDEYGDPSNNSPGILCQQQNLFCSEYGSNNGTSYFIDPENRTCEYRESATNVIADDGTSVTIQGGWFKKGTDELCVTTSSYDPAQFPDQPIPSSDIDISDGIVYEGWVGTCESRYDQCSLLVDPEPLPGGETEYYVLYNTIEDDIAACQQEGVVDRDAGCRLFADMSGFVARPAIGSPLAYDPALSQDGKPPVSSDICIGNPSTGEIICSSNTANVLMKVRPDRVCNTFLNCVSSTTIKNQDGESENVCLGIGLCSRIDSKGRCIEPEIFGFNDTPLEINVSNTGASSNPADFEKARWGTGLVKIGENWQDLGGISGYYPYHGMKQVGVPITIPNGGFEDEKNFNEDYSAWPKVNAAKIVKRTSGTKPYEGQRMLEMEAVQDAQNTEVSYVISNFLPASPNLEHTVSLYVNFDNLEFATPISVCTSGNVGRIGSECTSAVSCEVPGDGVCTPTGEFGFCRDDLSVCQNDADCSTGGTCGLFQCDGGDNDGSSCNPNFSEPCTSPGICRYFGPVGGISSVCTDGANSKLGASCQTGSDCSSAGVGVCEELGARTGFSVIIDQDDDLTNGNIEEYQVVDVNPFGGWQQISFTFTPPSNADEFRVAFVLENLAEQNIEGRVNVDNIEIRSGLKVATNTVVPASCRLYARTGALACDDKDLGAVTGEILKTYKGWRGYCVEPVPDKPNVCLNWWPVDIIQGDIDFFDDGEVVDMNIANDVYYCINSSGGVTFDAQAGYCSGQYAVGECSGATVDECEQYDGCTFIPGQCVGTTGAGGSCAGDDAVTCASSGPDCVFVPASCGGTAYQSCSIGSLDGSSVTTEEACDAQPSGCRWVAPNTTALDNPYLLQATTETGSGTVNRYADGRWIENRCDNDRGAYSSPKTIGGCSRDCGNASDCYKELTVDPLWNEASLFKSQIQSIKFVNLTGMEFPQWVVLDRSTETFEPYGNYYTIPDGWSAWQVVCNRTNPPRGPNGALCASSEDFLAVAVLFDELGRVARYWWQMDDYSGNTANGAAYRADYYVRDVCETVARVNTAYGAHWPWLSRFDNGDRRLFYGEKDQDADLFGSIAPPSNEFLPFMADEDNPWFSTPMFAMAPDKTNYCGENNFILESCARSGSPYACEGDCGIKRYCIEGSPQRLGSVCQTNNDCADSDQLAVQGVCGGFVGGRTDVGTQGDPAIAGDTVDVGVNRLKQLFAKSIDIYGWDYSQEKYVMCDNANTSFFGVPNTCASLQLAGSQLEYYDIRGCVGDSSFSPFCKNGDGSFLDVNAPGVGYAPKVKNLAVNGQRFGDVTIAPGQYVSLTFFPNIDPNRQPLKGIKVDWGDGTPWQPNLDVSKLAGEGLSVKNYFYVHQYASQPDPGYPRVQLKDNWGWCSGEVYECTGDDGGSWVGFNGQIIISE